MTIKTIGLLATILCLSSGAFAGTAAQTSLTGTVQDFDSHYFVLVTMQGRYRLPRSLLNKPDAIRPGMKVDLLLSPRRARGIKRLNSAG